MGNANCTLVNCTGSQLIVVVYNAADHINGGLIKNLYIIPPNCTRRLSAAADWRGLKLGLVASAAITSADVFTPRLDLYQIGNGTHVKVELVPGSLVLPSASMHGRTFGVVGYTVTNTSTTAMIHPYDSTSFKLGAGSTPLARQDVISMLQNMTAPAAAAAGGGTGGANPGAGDATGSGGGGPTPAAAPAPEPAPPGTGPTSASAPAAARPAPGTGLTSASVPAVAEPAPGVAPFEVEQGSSRRRTGLSRCVCPRLEPPWRSPEGRARLQSFARGATRVVTAVAGFV